MLPVFCASETVAFRVLKALSETAASRVLGAALESIFDDLEDVLGPDYMAPDEELPDLTRRMRGHLMLLLGAAWQYEGDDVRAARDLLAREVPRDRAGARIHLRRMALTCLSLLDHSAPLPPPAPGSDGRLCRSRRAGLP
ncbi:DUF6415 family natural product biosynthesis protein [Streptomyces lavendulae]|uniref:DUF6415 family natural product biosynthesis protein n=1 Tax=Streptomyces lavendulae TaxID=1914 RepID=UPI0038245856